MAKLRTQALSWKEIADQMDENSNNSYSPVSTLLNLADGLLSDCLNIQIVCSFNTDLSMVDKALMRKGRLIAKYEFKELEVEKAQNLSNKAHSCITGIMDVYLYIKTYVKC